MVLHHIFTKATEACSKTIRQNREISKSVVGDGISEELFGLKSKHPLRNP